MASDGKVPGSRLTRLAMLASAGAKTGVSLLTKSGAEAAAERTAEVLGRMRGIAAKAGQIASYVDGVLPEQGREAFQNALGALRDGAMTSPYEDVRRTIEEDLGAPVDRLFAEFEEEPFASASIGQVHRATLESERRVAVKVQHPGVDVAVENDLASASVLEPLVALAGGRKLDTKKVFAELSARLREELDYVLEAERQTQFRAVHAGDPSIRIPEVVRERSARRVLTSELASGVSLDAASARSEAERRAFAETLWRFVFKGNLVGGMFNADPHPGNYLFGEDGVVTFLDFGCVEPIGGDKLGSARELHASALRKDEADFRRRAAKLLQTRGGQWEELATGYSRRCFEPIFSSPFKITRPYAAELVRGLRDLGLRAKDLPKGEHIPVPEGMVFMNRLQVGFYSVLARLDVEVDYAAVESRFLREANLL